VVEKLITIGADVRARNRRGAEPLHYAVDGGPGLPAWNPRTQSQIIAMLISAGADPNAVDKSGVAPLHRVRNRCAAAVRALIDGGADPRALTRAVRRRCFWLRRTPVAADQDQLSEGAAARNFASS